MPPTIATDGSSVADRPKKTELDLEDATDRWRYTCAHGHRNWEPTNGGVWCRTCSRDHDIEDPHHHALLDQKTGESIPWTSFELEGDDEDE